MVVVIAILGGIMSLGCMLFGIIRWRKRIVRIRPGNLPEVNSDGINTNAEQGCRSFRLRLDKNRVSPGDPPSL